MADLTGTVVIAPIRPTSTEDRYPTHESSYGKGSYRTVQSLAERDTISDERREAGMLVWVDDEKTLYRLTAGTANSDWESLGNGSGQIRRKVLFTDTDLITIPNVYDYSILEVWVSADIYRPALFNEIRFNQANFNQDVAEGATKYNNYTVQYDIEESTLIVQLVEITSGVIVLY